MATEDIMDLLKEAEEAAKPSMDGLGQLSDLVQRMIALEGEKATLDAKSAEIGKAITELSERDIPAMLDQLKMREFTMTDGKKLAIKQTYVGKIPEDKKTEAFDWLESHGFGTIVKTAVEAEFGMGQLNEAKKLAAELSAAGYVVNADQSVHSSTLGKFVKMMLTEGKDIPQDLFNPMVLRRAKVS